MDMTPTITAWAPTTAASARMAAGEWRTARRPLASEPPAGAGTGAPPAGGPAGRGPRGKLPREEQRVGAKPGQQQAAGQKQSGGGDDERSGNGRQAQAWPTTAPGWIRLGPATAPIVMAHTTADRERPRCSASARSTAAKRACRLAAVPTPTPAAPRTRNTKMPETTDTTMRSAPARAAARPVARPILRPRRSASEASGSAASAAARVIMVATDPAHASEPDRSTASREPMETVAPVTIALSNCADPRSSTVRRCTWRTSGSAREVVAILRA